MNYNMKAEVERVRGMYVATIEVSGAGRAGNRRVSAETFEELQAKMKVEHDALLSNVQAYHAAGTPAAPITHHSEAKARQSGGAPKSVHAPEVEASATTQLAPATKTRGKASTRKFAAA